MNSSRTSSDDLFRTHREKREAKSLVDDLLDRTIGSLNFKELYNPDQPDQLADLAYRGVIACIESGNQDLLKGLSTKLAETSSDPSGVILVLFLHRMDALIKTIPSSVLPIHGLWPFYKAAFPRFLDTIDPEDPTNEDLEVLLRPVLWSGDGKLLAEA